MARHIAVRLPRACCYNGGGKKRDMVSDFLQTNVCFYLRVQNPDSLYQYEHFHTRIEVIVCYV
jgi:hypothetical protein